jgi:hypothetical protein
MAIETGTGAVADSLPAVPETVLKCAKFPTDFFLTGLQTNKSGVTLEMAVNSAAFMFAVEVP